MSEDLPSTQRQSEADKWRHRYEVEAQQRRKEYAIAQKTIQQLRAEVQQLCQLRPKTPALPPSNQQPATLQTALTQAEAERDRLAKALVQEQEAHAKTRNNLIGALSDAMGRPSASKPPALPEGRS
ncbi:hypothetical protein [Acaryochloris thomasi]|uniref:hypothetical protein n=1 Tax=Acaryochloris thomasi TaxID=2929456 RepID=UPI0011B40C74|nr:hypothetical protein [Acaryochloris thomasi]